MGKPTVKYDRMIMELDRLFALFNDHWYNGSIETPIILVQSNGKLHRTMGWCSTQKIWRDKSSSTYYYEITICAEYLYRDVEDICATILHEMVHLYNGQINVKDTSRGNTYHNKKFKTCAEEHGLIISYDKSIGWSPSTLNDDAKSFIKSHVNKRAFVLTRGVHGPSNSGGEDEDEKPTPKKQSSRKYVCPQCGIIVRATKDVNILCGDCLKKLIQQ